MAKGKKFKMPIPLFNKTFWNHFGSVAVNFIGSGFGLGFGVGAGAGAGLLGLKILLTGPPITNLLIMCLFLLLLQYLRNQVM